MTRPLHTSHRSAGPTSGPSKQASGLRAYRTNLDFLSSRRSRPPVTSFRAVEPRRVTPPPATPRAGQRLNVRIPDLTAVSASGVGSQSVVRHLGCASPRRGSPFGVVVWLGPLTQIHGRGTGGAAAHRREARRSPA